MSVSYVGIVVCLILLIVCLRIRYLINRRIKQEDEKKSLRLSAQAQETKEAGGFRV